MATLTVTAKGQVTFRKGILRHLGVHPGDKIALELLPDGRAAIRAAEPSGNIAGFCGLLAGRSKKVATLDELDRAAKSGWSGK